MCNVSWSLKCRVVGSYIRILVGYSSLFCTNFISVTRWSSFKLSKTLCANKLTITSKKNIHVVIFFPLILWLNHCFCILCDYRILKVFQNPLMVLFLVYLNIKAFWCILHVHIKLFTFTVLFSTINEDKCLLNNIKW